MKRSSSIFVFALILAMGCDRTPKPVPTKEEEKKEIEITEVIEISVESAIDGAVSKAKANVEAAHQKGQRHVVGLISGKDWLAMDQLSRIYYIRGLGDNLDLTSGISTAANEELETQRSIRKLEHSSGKIPSYVAGTRAATAFEDRLREVIFGRTFGDVSDAVTKFYSNRPLLKDRPVVWVLSVALYKEVKASEPTPAKGSLEEYFQKQYDSVLVELLKKVK